MDIELADAVASVREELLTAAARDSDPEIAFAVGPIELEFAVELRADARAKTGFKAWVLSTDIEAGGARARTHRVKVTLTPKRPDGTDLLIAAAPDASFGPGGGSGSTGHLGR